MNPSGSTIPIPICPSARAEGWSASGARLRRGAGFGLLIAVVTLLAVKIWPDAAEREASRWLSDFHRVRQESGTRRMPDWPLSFAGQSRLVQQFVQPETRFARQWDNFRQRLPPAVRNFTPRLPLVRDRVIAVGPALIELPKTPALRMALLDAALIPKAANRSFAVLFSSEDWPVPARLLPWFECLAMDEDVSLRIRVALALHGIPPGDPGVERLLGQMEADQVASVREAAHYNLRSDHEGVAVPWPLPHAPTQ